MKDKQLGIFRKNQLVLAFDLHFQSCNSQRFDEIIWKMLNNTTIRLLRFLE